MFSLKSPATRKVIYRIIVGAAVVIVGLVMLPPMLKGPSNDAPYANIPSTGFLLAILAAVFIVSQLSRKLVLNEPARTKVVATKFVSMTPKARRNRLIQGMMVCSLATPIYLLMLYSVKEPSPLLLLPIPILLVFYIYFATLIPAIFNSAEFRDETVELDGVQTGKVVVPFQSLLKVEQKRSWVGVIELDSHGDILCILAKDEAGDEQEYRIRLLKDMAHRELFISLLKKQCRLAY
ncbi:hypothetical protein J6I90_12030 [Pseudidiomarina sp. 1APP75-32.1]|uniref:Uncharacterized protein n=1 Tax=Pseudidiomarina terrestris TaxID=2820060 RepID=A0AAW7R4D3_9GAMM|nr:MULTISPECIES: hypothetical protein [unclassified Pseudidiomarina]MDN7125611.1 hypothetical protein [Pseudidiomarina sp. 1APP75-32.1]MDN7126139.1 hypothetical protein [Pseudidiomarina sp. 1APR75-33.1]MDN7130525.1 hypothetical protein [Pseudidiomarina sp. 1APR75-15]